MIKLEPDKGGELDRRHARSTGSSARKLHSRSKEIRCVLQHQNVSEPGGCWLQIARCKSRIN